MNGLALHSAFFVALNRLKTFIFLKMKGVCKSIFFTCKFTHFQSDALFVVASILASFIISSLRIIDQFCCSNQYFVETHFGNFTIFVPQTDIYDVVRTLLNNCVSPSIFRVCFQTLRTIADIETATVCGSTFAVNLLLAFLLARRQNHAENVR